ncbi:hypothetical protein J7L60_04800 [Candidatus Bathyarchaeota archaeon]|nr:hypothetical protein [Candidatus Bathyarchaeota archaeon]
MEEARKLVLEYLKRHKECMTSDVIRDLKLDQVLILKVIGKLKEEGKIEVIMGKVISL